MYTHADTHAYIRTQIHTDIQRHTHIHAYHTPVSSLDFKADDSTCNGLGLGLGLALWLRFEFGFRLIRLKLGVGVRVRVSVSVNDGHIRG